MVNGVVYAVAEDPDARSWHSMPKPGVMFWCTTKRRAAREFAPRVTSGRRRRVLDRRQGRANPVCDHRLPAQSMNAKTGSLILGSVERDR